MVGVNRFTETAESPLVHALDGESTILVVDRASGGGAARAPRTAGGPAATPDAVARALDRLRARPRRPTEQPGAGDDRTSHAPAARSASGPARCARSSASTARPPASAARTRRSDPDMARGPRAGAGRSPSPLGHPIRILVGKPGLDGHSNGAEQIAVAARDAGMEVIYQGIRLTPEQIAAAARDEDVDLVGLSVLSGSHRELVPETVRLLRDGGRRRAGRRRRHHPRGRPGRARGRRRGPRLHAEGLPHHRDRRRARRPRGGPE